jgi:tRNA dimethylallyltransferase
MSTKKINIIAIIGPTAVGKTELSLKLAEKLGAEVISVDSRQVYRYLDVGTDKVSNEVRKRIPHHLIDVVDPDQIYSAADFEQQASDAVSRIVKRDKIPLLIGGTAFYYKALCGTLSEELPKDVETRAVLEQEIKDYGLNYLHKELCSVDPISAAKIHPNDPVRIMRSLEIYRITGKSASWWYATQKRIEQPYNILYIGLNRNRADLYKNIDQRVHKQFANGYPEEVKWLLERGYSPQLPALQGFGYRELVKYVLGKCSYDEALDGDIRSTKTFARRQMTWFKHFEPTIWYDLDLQTQEEVVTDVLPKCLAHITGRLSDENNYC